MTDAQFRSVAADQRGMDARRMEQRIGKRKQIRSIPMAWCRDPQQPDRHAAESQPDGRITEISVSGLGMVAVTHPNLRVGDRVMIASLGQLGIVIARRIDPDVYPGESYYGVELVDPNSAFTQTIHRTFLAIEGAPEEYIPRG